MNSQKLLECEKFSRKLLLGLKEDKREGEFQMKPNILLIVMDTQRADNISCYGYSQRTTPNIDRIASEGAIFLNNISPGLWTLPSHASLFTGRYVSGHGACVDHEFLPSDFPTMSEVLRKIGYQTVGFSNNGWVSRRTGIARGFEEFYLVKRRIGEVSRFEWFYVDEDVLFEEGEEPDKGSLKTVALTINWIEKRLKKKRPFFIFINFIEPHGPYWPPQPFRSRFLPKDVSEEEAKSAVRLRSVYECIDYRAEILKLTEKDWRVQKALYDGCTATVDDRIGRLYSYLEDKEILDETILIITSDHGDVQGEHPPHIEHHLCAYDELIRVPLIMRYPSVIPSGLKIKLITQTHDIFPTILDMINYDGKEYRETIQSKSFLSVLDGESSRRFAVTEYRKPVLQLFLFWRRHPKFDVRRYNYWLKAIRTERYKYIWHSNGIDELYDLKADPFEKNNLANKEIETVERLRNMLENFLLSIDQVDYGDYPLIERRVERFGEVAKEVHDRLRAWGFYRRIKTAEPPQEKDEEI